MRPKKPFEGHPRNPERPKKRFESPSRTESARKTLWKATPKISGDRKNVSEATSKTPGDQKSNSEATRETQSRPPNTQMSTPQIQNDRGTAPTVVLRTSTKGQSLGRPPSNTHPKPWHRSAQCGPPSSDSTILVSLQTARRPRGPSVGRDRRAGQTSSPFRHSSTAVIALGSVNRPLTSITQPGSPGGRTPPFPLLRNVRPHRSQLQLSTLPHPVSAPLPLCGKSAPPLSTSRRLEARRSLGLLLVRIFNTVD